MSAGCGTLVRRQCIEQNQWETNVSVWTDDQHDAWFRLGARMGDLVEVLSGRRDLAVRISPDLRPAEERMSAPLPAAFFTPAQARTSFNASAVLREHMDDPDAIDPCDQRDQARHPDLIGAAIHECAHAAHTRLSFPAGTSRAAAQWATLLEESRCEKRALERRPQDASMLRISTHSLVANGALHADGGTDEQTMHKATAARASLLLLARVDNGVLWESDVHALRERVTETLGQDTLDALREVWLTAQDLPDDARDDLIACGQRIQDILDDIEPEPEQPSGQSEQSQDDSASQNDSASQDQSGSAAQDSDETDDQNGSAEQGSGNTSSGAPGSASEQSEDSSLTGPSQDDQQAEGDDSPEGADGSSGDVESNPQGSESDNTEDGDRGSGDESPGSNDTQTDSDQTSQDGTSGTGQDTTEADQGSGGDSQTTADGSNDQQADSDGSGGNESQDEAFRMPCGSWTEGNLPEGAQDTVEAPRNESSNPIEQAAREGTAQGASEARRQIAVAAGIAVGTRDSRAERAAERASTAEAARAVFSSEGGTRSVRITIREVVPDATAQRMARQLGQAIKAAQFRDVTRTRVASMTPPGRLNIREAANRAAQVARREAITATPWTQTRRRLVDNPPLTVGIAMDVSLSMDAWQRPVSTFGWALSKAVRDLQGTVAAAAWNGTNTAIIHPGRGSRMMKVISCGGGSSACPTALDALDGALSLCDGEGVRVAVVVTDGQLPNMDEVQKRANRLRRSGVLLLWVITSRTGREVEGAVNIRLDGPASFANVVSRHITRALSTI